MKESTKYILIASVFALGILVIYYLYTRRQAKIAEKELALRASQGDTGTETNLYDVVSSVGTGVLGLFKKTPTPAPANTTTTTTNTPVIQPTTEAMAKLAAAAASTQR